jgi:hypothetical protein
LPRRPEKARAVAAWKPGYGIGAASGRNALDIFLTPLPGEDNEDYAWVDPAPDANRPFNCGNCHDAIYREWQGSGHAHSARNPRFSRLFDGRRVHGPPASSWNLRREHPLGAGVCAACHAPTFSDSTLEYDLAKVEGVAAKGVHCDYCHKVVAAPTDKLGTRFGRDGLQLLRPARQEQLFFGPLDDAVRAGESFGYAPLYKESRYCASCHEGIVFGVHVYGTYSEWFASPARVKGQQCQTCHMAPTGTLTNIAPGKGGVSRDPWTLASHSLAGGTPDMLRRCLDVAVNLTRQPSGVAATVTVAAENVGHRVPTGFIDRNLVLLVEPLAGDKRLGEVTGPRLPASAGKKLAGLPGRLYAKQLHAPDGQAPIPFWLPAGNVVDTRLLPAVPDQMQFIFPPTTTKVRIQLLYRRLWPIVADDRPDMDNETVVLDRTIAVE